jgi:GTPase SAR1 family protein
MASSPASSYDCSFKVLLIGDSAVGKSSLLVSFVSAYPADDDIAPTIGTHHDSTSKSPPSLTYTTTTSLKVRLRKHRPQSAQDRLAC